MSEAMKCDRCGKYQSGCTISTKMQRLKIKRYRFNRHANRQWDGSTPGWGQIELCSECSRGLDYYLCGYEDG